MRPSRRAIRVLLSLAVALVASWGWGAGGDEVGRAAGGARPLGVTDAGGDIQTGLLTIQGHNLLPVEGELQVKLGGQVLEVASATRMEIRALLPAGILPGTYLLEVLAGPEASWAAPVAVGDVADGAPPGLVQVSLLRVREAHADLVAGTLLLRGEALGTSPDTTPTVTLSNVPLTVLSATEVEVLAQLPGALEAGSYRLRVVRTAPGGTASIWTDAMDVTTVAGVGKGDITAVNTPAGGGLQGGVTSGDASLSLLSCGLDQVLKSDGSTWSCAADSDTDTGVNAVVGGGGVTGVIETRTLTLGSTATPTNTAGAIVARDGTGSFSAGSVGLAGNLDLPNTASATVGVLTKGGTPFLHNSGLLNTFVGAATGNFVLTGQSNSAFGYAALSSSTTGSYNSAFGDRALHFNSTGANNSAFGFQALSANTTGYENSAFGFQALRANTTGAVNSAFGYAALQSNTTGTNNSAFGWGALSANTTASGSSAFGDQALSFNSSGANNSAFGFQALSANTTASGSSAFGYQALSANTTGSGSSAFGYQALSANTTGGSNSAFGNGALSNLSIGSGNLALGWQAGSNLTSGNYNIYIGNLGSTVSEAGTIRIGESQTATYIAGIYSATATTKAVYVGPDGHLGTLSSSRRYKEQIADMDAESDVLLKLRPVSFYYRPELDGTHVRQHGLVAEEVAEVAPGLVDYGEDGQPQTVRYHLVNAMLLNEVQKQRRRLEAQDALIQDLQDHLAQLEARLP